MMELTATGISKRFFRGNGQSNYFYAVKDGSLTLSPGTLTAVTGRSGSGKSTLLHILSGLLTPEEGQVTVGETDLYAGTEEERAAFRGAHLGVIPQGTAALHALTVLENVLLPAKIAGIDIQEQSGIALLEQTGIAHLKDVYPDELSGGELRRLSIARALLRNPAFLFADEPTGDLDDENTELVMRLLRQKADEGCAVLLVTHEEKAAACADKRLRMDNGQLLHHGVV